ncbi:TPA: BRCT domain-containing protein [Haemophilus influenzae]
MTEFLAFLVFVAATYGFYYIFRLKAEWTRLASAPPAMILGWLATGLFYALATTEHYFIAFIAFAASIMVFNIGEELHKKKEKKEEAKTPILFSSSMPSTSYSSKSESSTPIKKSRKNVIEFTYTNAQGETSEREVRVDYTDDVYIEGYCYVAGDNRTFRLDRIDGLIEQNGEFYTVDEWLEQRGIRKNQYQSKLSSKSTSSQLEICFTGFSKVDREYLESLAEIHDFKVRKTVTKNLNFLIMGDNAGPTKINSAIDVGATLLDENEFKTMIETGEIPQ